MKLKEFIKENFPLPVDGRDIFLHPNEKIVRVVVGDDLGKPQNAYVSSLSKPIKKGETTFIRTFTLPDPNNPGNRFFSVIPLYHLKPYPEDEKFWNMVTETIEQKEFPLAGGYVDGLLVRKEIPNTDSIAASLGDNYEVLRGIREVPMSVFGGPRSVFYAADDFDRAERLAKAIEESGEINPLIIVVDNEGPYILEGSHRYVALFHLKKQSFPALVVLELEEKG